MKPFLFLTTRSDDEPAGAGYEVFFKRTGLDESTLRRLRLETESLPQVDLDDWSGILMGGSPFNTSAPVKKKSTTQKRVEVEFSGLLDRVITADSPFFGAYYDMDTLICHQGAIVDTTYGETVTTPGITLTEAGLADPICAGVPKAFQTSVAYKEAVTTLPPHAVVLGTGETYPVQIFRIDSNLYAAQLHPGLDGDYLTHRLGFYVGHDCFADDELTNLQARVRLDDVSDSQKLLTNFMSVHARDWPAFFPICSERAAPARAVV